MTDEADRQSRVIRPEILLESEDELTALHAAILAAKASELIRRSEIRRRVARRSAATGSEVARKPPDGAAEPAELRWKMLDRLLAALDRKPSRPTGRSRRQRRQASEDRMNIPTRLTSRWPWLTPVLAALVAVIVAGCKNGSGSGY